jgi:intracellular sulfur oxidation DsrE/DsrF family protein
MSAGSEVQRRTFIGALAGSAVSLLTAEAALAAPGSAAREAVLQGEEWLRHLHGGYRQYFDAVTFNDAFPLYYAFNWWQTMKAAYQLSNADICQVIGLRHLAIAPAFKDTVWKKYKLGEFFKINDPKTKAPAVRNFTNSEAPGDLSFAGSSIGQQVANGAVVVVCNLATTVLSGMTAKAAGLSMTAEEAYAEWKASLLPGCYLVPSGVLAVHRAQKTGGCTYCFAG